MDAFYRYVYFGVERDKKSNWMDDYPAPDRSTRRYSSESRWITSAQQEFHLSLIGRHKSPTGRRLLEIGSGRGGFLKLAAARNYDVFGLEPSGTAVREAIADGLDVCQGTMEDTPDRLRGKSWDVIFMSHVFEHLPDPRAAVKTIWNQLSEGGIVVIEVPNQFESWLTRCGDLFRVITRKKRESTLYSVHHLSFFSVRHLERLFMSEGFEVVSTSWIPKRFNSPSNIVRSVIEWIAETAVKQGSNIQLVATRPMNDT